MLVLHYLKRSHLRVLVVVRDTASVKYRTTVTVFFLLYMIIACNIRLLYDVTTQLFSMLWNAPFTCMGLPDFRW